MGDLVELFVSFCKMGAMTFGGGYAMLPILQRELVDRRRWVTTEEILDYVTMGQCTPGVIAVNVSTLIGFKRKGVAGAAAAAVGFILPSLIIITAIAGFLTANATNPLIQRAFAGIRVAVGALILDAVVKLYKRAVKDWLGIVICVAAFLLSAAFQTSPVPIILAAGMVGFLLYRPKRTDAK